MKYIFIAGLEHSGTTLINHLLCQHPRALGLGEVASFFSVDHMSQYIAKWGKYPDVRLCSCGQSWDECSFWSDLIELNGLYSDLPLIEKYSRLFQHIVNKHNHAKFIIDSSKSLSTLKQIVGERDTMGLRKDDIFVILAIKDVRNFAASIAMKEQSRSYFINYLKSFNWWLGANKLFLDFFDEGAVKFEIVLYEKLCFDPAAILNQIWEKCQMGPERLEVRMDDISNASKHRSHIAMGNKDFVIRNSSRIRYDFRWFLEDRVHLAYLLHNRARKFNKSLYF